MTLSIRIAKFIEPPFSQTYKERRKYIRECWMSCTFENEIVPSIASLSPTNSLNRGVLEKNTTDYHVIASSNFNTMHMNSISNSTDNTTILTSSYNSTS